MAPPPAAAFYQEIAEADISIWKEALFAADLLLLHASPVYYGLGIPHGDGSAVLLVPGFLGTDAYLTQLHSWLGRIGYRPYFSGIGLNAECPNLLIQRRLNDTISKAVSETGRKIHLIGHSLGGIIARALACQRSADVASVITLASPFPPSCAPRKRSVARYWSSMAREYFPPVTPAVVPAIFSARSAAG